MFSYKSLFDVYDLRFPPYNAENALCSKFNAFPEAYFGLTLYVSLSSLLKFVVDIILLKILMPRNKQLQKLVCSFPNHKSLKMVNFLYLKLYKPTA